MATIAITGATGFLGRALVTQLIEDGDQLRCWIRGNSPPIRSRSIEWVVGELGDRDASESLIDGCDAVIHSGIWRSTSSFQGDEPDIVDYAQRNVMGSLQLIDCAYRSGVKKFVYVSSCAVHEQILDDRPLDETHPLWCSNHYGAHKAAVEKFVHSYGLGKGFQVCALRPTAIYGVCPSVEKSRWYEFADDIVNGKAVHATGGGKLVHVHDVVKAVRLLLNYDDVAGQSYSLCEGYFSNYEVAQRLAEIASSSSQISGTVGTPKHQIVTDKLKRIGMEYGGRKQLEQTLTNLIAAISKG